MSPKSKIVARISEGNPHARRPARCASESASARYVLSRKGPLLPAIASLMLLSNFGVSAALAGCYDPASDRATSGSPSKITFENRTRETLQISWIDYSGNTKLYSTLGPGRTFSASTFVTHKWIATTLDGTCVGTVFRSDGDRVFPLTVSSTSRVAQSDSRQHLIDQCYARGQTYQLSMISRCNGYNYCIVRADAPTNNYISQCVDQVERGGDPTPPPSLGGVQAQPNQPPGALENAPPVYSNPSQRGEGYGGFR